MLQTISAKEIQRGYKKVFEQANKEKSPILVITNNKPVGAIIGVDLLDRLENLRMLDKIEKDALGEYKRNGMKVISTVKELEKDLEELEQEI